MGDRLKKAVVTLKIKIWEVNGIIHGEIMTSDGDIHGTMDIDVTNSTKMGKSFVLSAKLYDGLNLVETKLVDKVIKEYEKL